MKRTMRVFWGAVAIVAAAATQRAYVHNSLNRELVSAAKRLDGPAVKSCLDRGADPNVTDPETRDPLWTRLWSHFSLHPEETNAGDPLLWVVIQRWSDREVDEYGRRGNSDPPLGASEPTELVGALLARGADPNASIYLSPKSIAWAVGHGYKKCVRMLLEHGASANAPALSGDTVLTFAIRIDSYDIAYELVKHGANVNLPGKGGVLPMQIALSRCNPQIITLLREAGAHK